MTKYKSIDLYGLIEYAILMDEKYHVKDIDIDIIKKIIKIIDKQLLYSDTDFLEDDNKELYDDISLELSEISSKDKEKIKEGLQYFISQYDSRKLIGERLHPQHINNSSESKNNVKQKQVYLEFKPKNSKSVAVSTALVKQVYLEFMPKNRESFKQLLIEKKQAKRTIYYKNGQIKISYWNVRNFSMRSSLTANIKSSPLYKNAIENGIEKILFEIEDYDDSIIFANEQKSSYTDISLTQSSNKNLFKKKECINFTVTKQRISTPQTLTSEESYKIGCEFYKEGLYEKAQKHFSNLAEQGYSLAQKSLADMYFKGEGTEKDFSKALEWYEKSAEQGNDNTRLDIINIYYDNELFFKLNNFPVWLNEPHLLETAKANFLLGYIYFTGTDIEQNFSKALLFWQKAAIMGDAKSQFCLSCMYRDGIGVENDIEKAKELWDKCKDLLALSTINNLNKIFPRNL